LLSYPDKQTNRQTQKHNLLGDGNNDLTYFTNMNYAATDYCITAFYRYVHDGSVGCDGEDLDKTFLRRVWCDVHERHWMSCAVVAVAIAVTYSMLQYQLYNGAMITADKMENVMRSVESYVLLHTYTQICSAPTRKLGANVLHTVLESAQRDANTARWL